MRAIAIKEFRELRRDRRTLAMLFLLPILFLVVFGYAASFDVQDVPTVVVGPAGGARRRPAAVHAQGREHATRPATAPPPRTSCGAARPPSPSSRRRRAGGALEVLIDGTELFAAQAAAAQPRGAQGAGAAAQTAARPLRRRRAAAGAGRDPLQPRPAHRGHHDPGALRDHPRVRRHHRHRARRGARAPDRHHGAARRDAVPPARRVPRQDRAVPAHRRGRHGDRGGRRHAAVRRPLPRLRGDVRARLAAVPVRHRGDRRADLERVPDPGAGACSSRCSPWCRSSC